MPTMGGNDLIITDVISLSNLFGLMTETITVKRKGEHYGEDGIHTVDIVCPFIKAVRGLSVTTFNE